MVENGAARENLELLGSMPTITPAQWTTLACGCNPGVHGVTDFWNQDPENLDTIIYGLDSRLCQAEQLWNVLLALASRRSYGSGLAAPGLQAATAKTSWLSTVPSQLP